MKKILLPLIIGFIFTGIIFPDNAFAQSSSKSDNCPQGTKSEVRGIEIVCVAISNVKTTCPAGTYQGKDNQGNFACRDIDTNHIVDPKTGFMYNSQTGERILDQSQKTRGGLNDFPVWGFYPLIFFMVILVIIVGIKRGPSSGGSWNNPPSMRQLAILRNFGYDGPMPLSSREAWERIANLKRGGPGHTREELGYEN